MNDLNDLIETAEKIRKKYIESENKEKHFKGFLYDSLAMRYEKARDAQALAEARLWKSTQRASFEEALGVEQRKAIRDKIRFYQILDEAVGEHD